LTGREIVTGQEIRKRTRKETRIGKGTETETADVPDLVTEREGLNPRRRKRRRSAVSPVNEIVNANEVVLLLKSSAEESRLFTGIFLLSVLNTSHPCNIKPCKVLMLMQVKILMPC
jgi:hypothetical protein